ncbi:MAG: GNAT family N-acetyltransferase, partial [Anaerolineales bacterium]
MMSVIIETIQAQDHERISEIVCDLWGDESVVVHNEIFNPKKLEGFKAVEDDIIIGILHYQIRGSECEILTLASLREKHGVGTALINAIETLAKSNGCHKLSLITTNDNLLALGFYQRRGFHLKALFPNQVAQSRKI